MKFLRHLAAVVLAVAVIVGLGMLWAHASGGTGTGPERCSPRTRPSCGWSRSRAGQGGVVRVHSDRGFNLADTGNLIRTCEIEAVLAAVVITASVVRRRRRRMRRMAARAWSWAVICGTAKPLQRHVLGCARWPDNSAMRPVNVPSLIAVAVKRGPLGVRV